VEPANGSLRQLTKKFRIYGPGYIDRVEQRQPTALTNRVTMPTSTPSRWKITHVSLAAESPGPVHSEMAFVLLCRQIIETPVTMVEVTPMSHVDRPPPRWRVSATGDAYTAFM